MQNNPLPIFLSMLTCSGVGGSIRRTISLSSSAESITSGHIADTARRIRDTIRTHPRWEKTILSLHSESDLSNPNLTSLVLSSLDSNPLLSLRFLLFLSSLSLPSPSPRRLGPTVNALLSSGKKVNAFLLLRSSLPVPELRVFNNLISSLAASGRFGLVSETLHMMISSGCAPNIYTYTPVIHAMCCFGDVDEAVRIFREVKTRGYRPDSVCYNVVIAGLCRSGRVFEGERLLREMVRKGIQPRWKGCVLVIDGFFKVGEVERAREVFDEMGERGLVAWNVMGEGLCANGKVSEGVELAERMRKNGIVWDVTTYNSVIKGLCNDGETDKAMGFFRELVGLGLEPTTSTYAPLIGNFYRDGNVSLASEFVKEMEDKGLEPLPRTHDRIVIEFCKADRIEEGLEWLVKMLKRKRKPKEETLDELVVYLSAVERIDDALLMLNALFEMGCSLGKSVCSSLVDKLCSKGDNVLAEQVMQKIILANSRLQ